ncbi:MAG TPA: GDCCVxC domain-containing (seleno)protein [Desulfuromonadales bacterium]|nr:GDCCVxC domain-containing (seleno)protein [Desulfuromonadales bacterium]
MKIVTDSTLTCPKCGFAENLPMPTDACQFFHQCNGCGALIRPEKGDCCVFCSYGDVPCPPKQLEKPRES